jgi:hypothetical protein
LVGFAKGIGERERHGKARVLGRNLNSNMNLKEKVLKTHQISFQAFQL